MATIELKSLTKQFGQLLAVNSLDLLIPDRKFVALLGPSGCGKTTTMNMIAGIESASNGQILFDDKNVRTLPARERGVGFVFQNYAIFTHMTVYENLAFGLKSRGMKGPEIEKKVGAMAELMRLTDRLHWPSARLSVNEMQKVAIGRSAVTEPAIFLLDEPLSNLDAAFRAFMRTELKHLQHQFQQTMVYVTHDQIEAMSLADMIAVMNLGVLQQYGTPIEVYNRPNNTFVANFMGSPSMNLLDAKIGGGDGSTRIEFPGGGQFEVNDEDLLRRCKSATTGAIKFGARPEDIALEASGHTGDGVKAKVNFVEPIGPRTIVHLSVGEEIIKVVVQKGSGFELGSDVKAVFPKGKCHIFDAETGNAIGLE
jgi:multiple sugar transport system ATP-binding protein